MLVQLINRPVKVKVTRKRKRKQRSSKAMAGVQGKASKWTQGVKRVRLLGGGGRVEYAEVFGC